MPASLSPHPEGSGQNTVHASNEDESNHPGQGNGHPITTRLSNIANVVEPALSNNPILSAAIQVLDQIAEVGKVLPFVAPAFILLKIIIDLEKKAAEVDAKCMDLLERITFMESHIKLLGQLKDPNALEDVIKRTHTVLQDCVALRLAYSKQGRIARRLRLSNREKFVACADAITNCTSDLMASLQMRQALQIDNISNKFLERAVPRDEGDVAGEAFMSANGGMEAVISNSELVRRFAAQNNMLMDDTVMEQLSANISDSIKQTNAELNQILNKNVQSYIVDGLQNLASEMISHQAEQRFFCVQCEQSFTTRTNGPEACSFHRSPFYPTKKKQHECCQSTLPCRSNEHRTKHHCNYPYATFFTRIRELMRTTSTTDEWACAKDENLDDNSEQERAEIGKIISWEFQGSPLPDNTVYIMVGAVWYNGSYYFNTFTAAELQEVNRSVKDSGNTLIFRTTLNQTEYSMAEWKLSDTGDISGVRLTAKSATSAQPQVCVCPIDIKTCTKLEGVTTESLGGFQSFTADRPYELPQPILRFPVLNELPSRQVRKDFGTVTTQTFPLILKSLLDPPLLANINPSTHMADTFQGSVSIFNDSSSKVAIISSVTALYRMIGDEDYMPTVGCRLLDGAEDMLPKALKPFEPWRINFEVKVPRTIDDISLGRSWRDTAFVARYRPLRIKLLLEDIRGEKCTLIFDYVFQPRAWSFEKPQHNVRLLFFDNYITFERRHLHIRPSVIPSCVMHIEHYDVEVKTLSGAVRQAINTNKTEIDLWHADGSGLGDWEWSVYALVDSSCARVYALKVIMHDGSKVTKKHFGAVYYIPCPTYGNPSPETKHISYAEENKFLPDLEPYEPPTYPQDDDVNDVTPTQSPSTEQQLVTATPTSVPSITTSVLPDPTANRDHILQLDSRLAAIESKLDGLALINDTLSRIATTFEKLVQNVPESTS